MKEEIKQKWKSDLHKLIRVKLWLNEPVQIEMEKFVEDLLSQALQKRDKEVIGKISAEVIKKEMKTLQKAWSKNRDLYPIICSRVNYPFIDVQEIKEIASTLTTK